uniref:Ig-like domain-containing protein n=1 Tax=Periophthalmus magnuspinnatus TaxID=409849 RepID=A0A3B3ZN66_9GOBI
MHASDIQSTSQPIITFRGSKSQAAVEGKTGFSVLLPCVYTDSDLPPKPTVIWKDPREDTLLILNQTKIPKRVKTFPQLHSKGNFSILLQDLRASDSGDYECNIFHLDKQFVKLSIMTGMNKECCRGHSEVTPLCHATWQPCWNCRFFLSICSYLKFFI